jgi:tetratricopeptide (TPR) repeat protein
VQLVKHRVTVRKCRAGLVTVGHATGAGRRPTDTSKQLGHVIRGPNVRSSCDFQCVLQPTGYYIAANTNMDKYRETLELWATAYPRDWYPLFAIADTFNALGQYSKGIGPARQALQLSPDGAIAYERVAETYAGLNKWAEAKAVLESAVAARRDGVGVHEQLFEIAFVEGDRSAAARHAAFAAGKPDKESMLEARRTRRHSRESLPSPETFVWAPSAARA